MIEKLFLAPGVGVYDITVFPCLQAQWKEKWAKCVKRGMFVLACAQFYCWRIKLSRHIAECGQWRLFGKAGNTCTSAFWSKYFRVRDSQPTLILGFLILPKRFWDVSLTVVEDEEFKVRLRCFEWYFVLGIIVLNVYCQLHVASSDFFFLNTFPEMYFSFLNYFPFWSWSWNNKLMVLACYLERLKDIPASKDKKSAIPFLKF